MTGLNYYVYIYYSEEWFPYYVGKGHGMRCFQRRAIPIPDKEHIHRFYFYTEQEAFDTEIQLITHFGRICDGGTLMNLSTGGPGGQTGISPSEETRAKMRAAHIGQKHTEESRAKLRAAFTGRKHTKESRAKMRGRVVTEETRAKLSESNARTIPVWFVSPEQTLYEVTNVSQFARDSDLNQGHLNKVSLGHSPHHKGWTLHPSSPHLKLK